MMDKQLAKIFERYEELNNLLACPEIAFDIQRYQGLLKEQAKITPLAQVYQETQKYKRELESSLKLSKDPHEEKEFREMAYEEVRELKKKLEILEQRALFLLLPQDVDEEKNVILELRAGTGGEEASLFVADLFRMYKKYAENNRWRTEIISSHPTEIGGFKDISMLIEGERVYRKMKFEAGTHRVQRVPTTETQGRIHTSAITVAVLPETQETEIEINPSELRIDTYRSQGAGGQHVNTSDSAVRITHLPTNIVVTCQEERSQIKNRAKAMKYLCAKLYEERKRVTDAEEADLRKKMVGSGDRNERIRTYNFPNGRITDHRIKLTLYKLEEVLNSGALDELSDALNAHEQSQQLHRLSQQNR